MHLTVPNNNGCQLLFWLVVLTAVITIMGTWYNLLFFPGIIYLGFFELESTKAEYFDEVCLQPMDEGKVCSEAQPHLSYYFSADLEQCAPFEYKGCEGNSNRFILQDDCTDACQVEYYKRKNKKAGFLESAEKTQNEPKASDCKLPMDRGPCRAMITQWYFDTQSGTCKSFSYGGCKGNRNRFNTEDHCHHVCKKEQ